ncbi:MAG: alpha/beta hydrolase [Tropicimonas sp.]|uniref:alpha/beta hydrolase n=1 Tax=Tropicimonas sp. TaxID=2067044 RepID=UPI003A842CFB
MTRIYFASNRNVRHERSKSGNILGDRFNADGPQCFRVGEAEVVLSGDDPKDDASWKVGRTQLYPEDLDSRGEAGAKLGSQRLFGELRKTLKAENMDVIIYIHGFANSFQNSVQRAAALQELYSSEEQKVMVVMFSWPSNGRVQPAWNYFSDREDAEASGLAMGRALARLVDFLAELRREDHAVIVEARRNGDVPDKARLRQCTRRLHVMAHSMGNYALRHALLKYANINGGQIDRVLDCAFLMAADEDNDALTLPLKLKRLDELSNRIFVYHAANDIALTISDRTKGMPKRLGSDGPENLDRTSERVFALDCRKISDTALTHGRHQYYRLRDEAIADIRATLADIPQEDRPGRQAVRPGRSWRLRDGA